MSVTGVEVSETPTKWEEKPARMPAAVQRTGLKLKNRRFCNFRRLRLSPVKKESFGPNTEAFFYFKKQMSVTGVEVSETPTKWNARHCFVFLYNLIQ